MGGDAEPKPCCAARDDVHLFGGGQRCLSGIVHGRSLWSSTYFPTKVGNVLVGVKLVPCDSMCHDQLWT